MRLQMLSCLPHDDPYAEFETMPHPLLSSPLSAIAHLIHQTPLFRIFLSWVYNSNA